MEGWDIFMQAVTTIGFPIAMCGVMAMYVKYIGDRNREQISTIMQQHKEETDAYTEALNNNTLVMQKLCDKIGGGTIV